MDFELISSEEFDALPDDPGECFVRFESIVRRNMTEMISQDTHQQFDRTVQAQYMASVSAVAAECGVNNLPQLQSAINDDDFFREYGRFAIAVQGEVARIKIRQRGKRNPYSVLLTSSTRTKIEHYISRLRNTIDSSDLPASRKEALRDKLDQLVAELGNQRVGYGKTMAVLSAVLVGLASLTTIGAEGPAAVTNIMKLIAMDKETEDAAALRLTPPQKALPAPPPATKPLIVAQGGPTWGTPPTSSGDLDDEIPF